jgi:hypothetical protein
MPIESVVCPNCTQTFTANVREGEKVTIEERPDGSHQIIVVPRILPVPVDNE